MVLLSSVDIFHELIILDLYIFQIYLDLDVDIFRIDLFKIFHMVSRFKVQVDHVGTLLAKTKTLDTTGALQSKGYDLSSFNIDYRF